MSCISPLLSLSIIFFLRLLAEWLISPLTFLILSFSSFDSSATFPQYFQGYIVSSVSLFCSPSVFNICSSVPFSSLTLVLLGSAFFWLFIVCLFPDFTFQLSQLNFDFHFFLLLYAGFSSLAVVLFLYIWSISSLFLFLYFLPGVYSSTNWPPFTGGRNSNLNWVLEIMERLYEKATWNPEIAEIVKVNLVLETTSCKGKRALASWVIVYSHKTQFLMKKGGQQKCLDKELPPCFSLAFQYTFL